MSKHKPASTARHKVNKQARAERKRAKRKLYLGLCKDPKGRYAYKKQGR